MKDLPNWVPMYGRKICLEYQGIKKQCSACFGPHTKKFCKYERMSLEEYARRFRIQNPNIPEQYYGRLAKIENLVQSAGVDPGVINASEPLALPIPAVMPVPLAAPTPTSYVSVNNPTIKLSLRRDSSAGTDWAPAKTSAGHGNLAMTTTKNVTESAISFLNGIKASFRPTFSAAQPSPAQVRSPVKPIASVITRNPTVRVQSSRACRGRGKIMNHDE